MIIKRRYSVCIMQCSNGSEIHNRVYSYVCNTHVHIRFLYRTRIIPHVVAERVKPVTELPVPSSSVIYDVHVFEPHKGTRRCVVMPKFNVSV